MLSGAGLRALIYSGDHDLCVPHTGSEAWTAAMHHSDSRECRRDDDSDRDDDSQDKCDGVTSPWQPWFNSDVPQQVRPTVAAGGNGHKVVLPHVVGWCWVQTPCGLMWEAASRKIAASKIRQRAACASGVDCTAMQL